MPRKPLIVGGNCTNGHLLEGDNVRYEKSRVRCRTCLSNSQRKLSGLPPLDIPPPLRIPLVRGGKCINGHQLNDDNVYEYPKDSSNAGKIVCKNCRADAARKHQGYDHLIGSERKLESSKRTHCPQGHPYDAENTYVKPDNSRGCRKCTYTQVRRSRFMREYGITLEQFDAMLLAQSGRCAICSEIPDSTLHVDHDHVTGDVRQLLCSRCNTGLGQFLDNPELLMKAAQYIIEHKKA